MGLFSQQPEFVINYDQYEELAPMLIQIIRVYQTGIGKIQKIIGGRFFINPENTNNIEYTSIKNGTTIRIFIFINKIQVIIEFEDNKATYEYAIMPTNFKTIFNEIAVDLGKRLRK